MDPKSTDAQAAGLPVDPAERLLGIVARSGTPTFQHFDLYEYLRNKLPHNVEVMSNTPRRVRDALEEMTTGYSVNIEELLSVDFDAGAYDELVLMRDIEFVSLCEHHLMPFMGVVHLGYIPQNKVLGISKLARLVDAYAKRFQLQERMTHEIADALATFTEPAGVVCVVEASHCCVGCRGVRKPGARLVTSALLGCFHDDDAARAEVMQLIRS